MTYKEKKELRGWSQQPSYNNVFATDFTSLLRTLHEHERNLLDSTGRIAGTKYDDTLSSFFPCFATLLRYALNYVLNVLAQLMSEIYQK